MKIESGWKGLDVRIAIKGVLAIGVGWVMATGQTAFAQGCVASRGSGLSCAATHLHSLMGDESAFSQKFTASVGYRFLNSDRHFTGSHEDTSRQNEGSEVINTSHFTDLSLSYAFNPRYSATVTLPFVVNDRSQVVRSNNVARTILGRFHTQAAGMGDIRLNGNMWLLDPRKPRKANVLMGLGFDMPTGQKGAMDTFQVFKSPNIVAQERTVDQSIQPGDGGWGILLDLYGYYNFIPRWTAFVNGAYAITPEQKNGVPTFRSNPFEATMSIADSYMGRTGFEFVAWPKHHLTFSLAGRIEGVPVWDLVGGSDGFRRPGYAISVEPGVMMSYKSWSFSAYAPVAMLRNREQSVPDKQQTAATGTRSAGDAAFADYVLMFNISKKF